MKDQVSNQASVRRLQAVAMLAHERQENRARYLTGLWLRSEPSGHQSWWLRTRIKREQVRLPIGSAEAFSLAQAIAAAKSKLRQIEGGVDPRKVEAEAQEAAAAAEADTVAVWVERWLATDMADKRSRRSVERQFVKDVIPVLGHMPITAVTRDDALKATDRVVERGKERAEKKGGRPDGGRTGSRRLHAHMQRFFQWLIGRGKLTVNPLKGAEKVGLERSRDRYLLDWEIPFVWTAANEIGPYGKAIQLLLLTGARRNEIAKLEWKEVDRIGAMIRLPGNRVKRLPNLAQVGHEIPLSKAALAVLEQCPRPFGAVYVFSVTDGRSPVADWDRSKVLKQFREDVAARQAAAGRTPVEPFVLHDLRRTVASGMQALGVPFDVIEAVLGHVGVARSGVAGVYRRYPFANEKREALEKWGEHVMALVAKPIIPRKRLSPEAAAALASQQAAAVDPRVPPSYRGLGSKVVMREDGDGAGFVIGGSRPMRKRLSE